MEGVYKTWDLSEQGKLRTVTFNFHFTGLIEKSSVETRNWKHIMSFFFLFALKLCVCVCVLNMPIIGNIHLLLDILKLFPHKIFLCKENCH